MYNINEIKQNAKDFLSEIERVTGSQGFDVSDSNFKQWKQEVTTAEENVVTEASKEDPNKDNVQKMLEDIINKSSKEEMDKLPGAVAVQHNVIEKAALKFVKFLVEKVLGRDGKAWEREIHRGDKEYTKDQMQEKAEDFKKSFVEKLQEERGASIENQGPSK